MKFIFYYITLYYDVMKRLLFTAKKYLRMANLPFAIILLLYFLAVILYIICILEYMDIISVDPDTMDYLDELDFAIELPETEVNTQTTNNKISGCINIGWKFRNLFNNNLHYFINNSRVISYYNKAKWIDICEICKNDAFIKKFYST